MSTDDEFDRLATWTVDAIERLGADHAVPGACRGSGGPGALDWLARWLLAGDHDRFLDLGGGLGGPSGWLTDRAGVRPVLAEPMAGAAAGARRLFAPPAVQADGGRLPFGDASFDAAWSLGVLSTLPDPGALLGEAARVLRPGGRVGLVAYVSAGDRAVDEPEGNHFPTRSELEDLLAAAGLVEIDSTTLDLLPDADAAWNERAAAVDREIADQHRHEASWQQAEERERHVAELLDDGWIHGVVIRARGTGSR